MEAFVSFLAAEFGCAGAADGGEQGVQVIQVR